MNVSETCLAAGVNAVAVTCRVVKAR